jgi:hypothetical protein
MSEKQATREDSRIFSSPKTKEILLARIRTYFCVETRSNLGKAIIDDNMDG